MSESDRNRISIGGAGQTARRRLPTLLSPALKRLLAVAVAVAGFMLADTLYLLLVRLADRVGLDPFSLGVASLPHFYQTLLLAHTGAGLLLAGLMAAFLVTHLPAVWRRYHHEAAWTGVPYAVLGTVLTVTGLFIFAAAASEGNSWAWWLHAGAGVLAVAGYAAHRAVSHTRPPAARFARFLGAATASTPTTASRRARSSNSTRAIRETMNRDKRSPSGHAGRHRWERA